MAILRDFKGKSPKVGEGAFLADNPRDKYGLHHYSFDDTGIDPSEYLDRTKRYREHFDVDHEG